MLAIKIVPNPLNRELEEIHFLCEFGIRNLLKYLRVLRRSVTPMETEDGIMVLFGKMYSSLVN